MPQQPLPENELDAIYYHLMTAQQQDTQRAPDRQTEPATQHQPELEFDYEFHPDDVASLVTWEQQTTQNIALWLILTVVISTVLIPYAPFFTPVVALFFVTMSAFFYIRSRLTHEAQVIRDVEFYVQHPTFQWMSGGFTLAVSFLMYFFAVITPYSAVPSAVQPLLFLVAMNFALYTPISIMRVIRQRTLRRKHHVVD